MRMRAEGLPGPSEVQRSIQQHLFGRGGQRGGSGQHSDTPVTPQLRKVRPFMHECLRRLCAGCARARECPERLAWVRLIERSHELDSP